jgi:hypothetical protein
VRGAGAGFAAACGFGAGGFGAAVRGAAPGAAAAGFGAPLGFGAATGFGAPAGLAAGRFAVAGFGSAAMLIVAVCGFGRAATLGRFLCGRAWLCSLVAMVRSTDADAAADAGGVKLARDVAPPAAALPRETADPAFASAAGFGFARFGASATANSGTLSRFGPV